MLRRVAERACRLERAGDVAAASAPAGSSAAEPVRPMRREAPRVGRARAGSSGVTAQDEEQAGEGQEHVAERHDESLPSHQER